MSEQTKPEELERTIRTPRRFATVLVGGRTLRPRRRLPRHFVPFQRRSILSQPLSRALVQTGLPPEVVDLIPACDDVTYTGLLWKMLIVFFSPGSPVPAVLAVLAVQATPVVLDCTPQASASNPHRSSTPSAPAGSSLGGFRTPACLRVTTTAACQHPKPFTRHFHTFARAPAETRR